MAEEGGTPRGTRREREDFSRWWVANGPGQVHRIENKSDWEELIAPFRPGDPVLGRVYECLQEHGVQDVLVENRYIDVDYRSQHASFYSTTFQRHPTVCLRLHFFNSGVAPDLSNLDDLRAAYRGYMVLRPLTAAPVGRTMLAPPPGLNSMRAAICTSTESIDIFGHRYTITAMPFMSQDMQFSRCAHADLWMIMHHAHLRHGLPRRTPAEIAAATSGGQMIGRQIPSAGLSISQMLSAMVNLRLSPALIRLPESREQSEDAARRGRTADDRDIAAPLGLYDILCRYVRSQTPPIVVGEGHSCVLIGYARAPSAGHPRLTLIRHDDLRGPYLTVDDPWDDRNFYSDEDVNGTSWLAALPPLVPKIYMSAERAETLGEFWLRAYANEAADDDPLSVSARNGRLRFRTYAIRSTEYKQRCASRLPDDATRLFRLQHWPRYVWIVEAIDRSLRRRQAACVLGEAVIDATGSDLAEPEEWGLLALFAPRSLTVVEPDLHVPEEVPREPTGPIRSGCEIVVDGKRRIRQRG